jgi:hypothetical protein
MAGVNQEAIWDGLFWLSPHRIKWILQQSVCVGVSTQFPRERPEVKFMFGSERDDRSACDIRA